MASSCGLTGGVPSIDIAEVHRKLNTARNPALTHPALGASSSVGCGGAVPTPPLESPVMALPSVRVDETPRSPVAPPVMQDDKAALSCHHCKTSFGMFSAVMGRKHNCRVCGLVFCSDCASTFTTIPALGVRHPVRVCDTCYRTSKLLEHNRRKAHKNKDHHSHRGAAPPQGVSLLGASVGIRIPRVSSSLLSSSVGMSIPGSSASSLAGGDEASCSFVSDATASFLGTSLGPQPFLLEESENVNPTTGRAGHPNPQASPGALRNVSNRLPLSRAADALTEVSKPTSLAPKSARLLCASSCSSSFSCSSSSQRPLTLREMAGRDQKSGQLVTHSKGEEEAVQRDFQRGNETCNGAEEVNVSVALPQDRESAQPVASENSRKDAHSSSREREEPPCSSSVCSPAGVGMLLCEEQAARAEVWAALQTGLAEIRASQAEALLSLYQTLRQSTLAMVATPRNPSRNNGATPRGSGSSSSLAGGSTSLGGASLGVVGGGFRPPPFSSSSSSSSSAVISSIPLSSYVLASFARVLGTPSLVLARGASVVLRHGAGLLDTYLSVASCSGPHPQAEGGRGSTPRPSPR